MVPLQERLAQTGVIIADGAMGTMLFRRGLKPGDCPERMNLDAPEILEEVTGLYLEAGAEIVQTNTFGGSPLKLSSYALEGKTEEINARAVQAARNAAGERAYVSASCGPCGRILEPYGDTSAALVFESFRRQLRSLIAEGVDLVCIETMIDLAEARLAITAARSISASIPVCATMTFDPTPKGFRTVMGVDVEQAAKGLADAGAQIIGSNCGNGIVLMTKIAQEFKAHTNLPIIIQSNAGIPSIEDGSLVYPETPEFMAEKSVELLKIGVKILGGCCGTTPEHTAALKRVASRIDE